MSWAVSWAVSRPCRTLALHSPYSLTPPCNLPHLPTPPYTPYTPLDGLCRLPDLIQGCNRTRVKAATLFLFFQVGFIGLALSHAVRIGAPVSECYTVGGVEWLIQGVSVVIVMVGVGVRLSHSNDRRAACSAASAAVLYIRACNPATLSHERLQPYSLRRWVARFLQSLPSVALASSRVWVSHGSPPSCYSGPTSTMASPHAPAPTEGSTLQAPYPTFSRRAQTQP